MTIKPRSKPKKSAFKSFLLVHGLGPTRDELASISNENERIVIAIAALLFSEMDSQKDKWIKIRATALDDATSVI